jgi:hypothetical protein
VLVRGVQQYMLAPCAHVVAALKFANRLSSVNEYFDPSWTTEMYRRAYDPAMKIPPFVIKEDLLRFAHHEPPTIGKKRGRPKESSKKRIESQPASLALAKKSTYKCTSCKQVGHNKRSCTNT